MVHPDHLAEVACRLRAIALVADASQLTNVTAADRLGPVRDLAAWAALHLAVVREHEMAA